MNWSDTGASASFVLNLPGLQLASADGVREVRRTAIRFTGVETTGRARDALEAVTNRIEDLSLLQSTFGAYESRLASISALTAASAEALKAAEAQLRDADIAAEAAGLTSSRINEEAAAAVLAQANQQPALALRLLL